MPGPMQLLRNQIAAWWPGQAGRGAVADLPGPDPWRFRPAGTADLFTRATVLHFPVIDRPRHRRLLQGHVQNSAEMQKTGAIPGSLTGDFSGFAAYQPGDDVRHLDWRATARTRQPMIRQWEGQSQKPVVIVVDVSASLWYASEPVPGARPIDAALEMAILIAAAALARQMPVNLLLVSDRVELHLKHLQGRRLLGQLLAQFTSFQPVGRTTDWSPVQGELQKIRPGAWLFWLSDFLWLPEPDSFYRHYQRFQPVGLCFQGPPLSVLDQNATINDIETGVAFHSDMQRQMLGHTQRLYRWARQAGMPVLQMPQVAHRPELLLNRWLAGGMESS